MTPMQEGEPRANCQPSLIGDTISDQVRREGGPPGLMSCILVRKTFGKLKCDRQRFILHGRHFENLASSFPALYLGTCKE